MMRASLVIWPRLATLKLVFWTLRLWLIGLLLPLVILVLPYSDAEQTAARTPLLPYAKALLVIVIATVIGKIPDWLAGTRFIWRICEALLADAIARRNLPMQGMPYDNLRPQRLKGMEAAWRTSLSNVETVMLTTAGALPPSGARAMDAAQRILPWTMCALLLCVGALLAPWAWPKIELAAGARGLELVFEMVLTWLLAGVVLGCCLSIPVGCWIHHRCK